MTLRAEWDPVSQLVIAFLDDEDPYRPRQATGAPRTPGIESVVLPVQSRYPDPYVATLPELLGMAVVRWDADANVLIREWPAANFTPAAVRAGLKRLVDNGARGILGLTDWMLMRQMETDEPMPDEVKAQRAAVRAWSTERKATLQTASAAQLLSFDVNPPASVLMAPPPMPGAS